jgi:DNA-binding MarR family transcriptional regulator
MMAADSTVRRLESFLSQIRVLDDAMPVQQLACFLAIAHREGQSIVELSRSLGLAQSSASRNVSSLSDWDWEKRPGLDLVETKVDPLELRKKQVVLTSKGRRLVEQIESIFREGK